MANIDRETRKSHHQIENPERRRLRALVFIGKRGRGPGQATAFGTALNVPWGCHLYPLKNTELRRHQTSVGKRATRKLSYSLLHVAAWGVPLDALGLEEKSQGTTQQ